MSGDPIERVERWYCATPLDVPVPAMLGGEVQEAVPTRVFVDWDRLGVWTCRLFVFGSMAFTAGVTLWLFVG
jgi:hypothetical protein